MCRWTENRLIELEIKVAYQDDLLQALNNIVAQQQQQIDRIERAYKNIYEQMSRLVLKTDNQMIPEYEPLPPHY